MSDAPASGRLRVGEVGRFLEIQNLGLNLPFAIAFLLLAARGVPPAIPTLLLVVAFVAARNAGHSFNRWYDRDLDAKNPRTEGRALVTGRLSPAFALTWTASSAVLLFVAAALLNPLALALSPVALLIVLGYSWTKRRTAWTTVVLGLVESITPAAVYIGLTGRLPFPVLAAVFGLLLWGTAFETIHSLGDLAVDRALGLPTLPGRLGEARSLRLLPALHAAALLLLGGYGVWEGVRWPYFLGLAGMAVLAAVSDRHLALHPGSTGPAFRLHAVQGLVFLAGAATAMAVAV